MQRDTTANTTNANANVVRYDASLARDIAQRERDSDARQRERDARRADYDAALASMPITLALRTMRVPTSPTQGATKAPRVLRPHKDGQLESTRQDPRPNAWETNSPRPSPGSHKHECPDMHLVKCHHKW